MKPLNKIGGRTSTSQNQIPENAEFIRQLAYLTEESARLDEQERLLEGGLAVERLPHLPQCTAILHVLPKYSKTIFLLFVT